MNRINAKIYYLTSTGEVLVITSEGQDNIEKTNREQDMEFYPQLKGKSIDEVDYIELEYGTLVSTFNNVKSYSVNLETKTLEVIYTTQEELDAIQRQNQELQDLTERTSYISEYIQSQDKQVLTGFEDYILEIEKNKILNGGM